MLHRPRSRSGASSAPSRRAAGRSRGALAVGLAFGCAVVGAVLSASGFAALRPARPLGAAQEVTEIAWVEAKLDVVLARALDRNVPLVIFACLADEVHNEEFRRGLAGNATLAKALIDAIPMYASNGEPPPGAALTKHKELMDEVYNRFVAEETPDGSWPLPEVLVVLPTGEVSLRLGSGHTVPDGEVVRAVKDTNEKLGGGVSDVTVTALAALRDAGRKATDTGDWVGAWRAWRGILAVTPAGPFAAEAKVALPAAEKELTKLLEASVAGVDEANVADRYATLRDVARRARGTELEKVAARHAATVEKDKRFKPLLPALRLEEEATDILFDAEALLAKGDEAGAVKALKRLAAKKYNETRAAARMRAEHAERLK